MTLHSNRVLDRLRTHRTLATIVAIYFAGFLTLGIITSNPQVPYYAVFMMGTLGAVLLWDTRRNLSTLSLGGLALWGGLHLAGGMVPIGDDQVLYNLWLLPFVRFDHVVHAVGFGFSGLAFSDALGPRPSLALVGGLGFGALNEMVEFLITRIVPDTNIGGFENTGWDLVANTVGAVIAAVWVATRPGTKNGSKGKEHDMADLDAEDRGKIPTREFGLPEKARTKEAKKESGNYPMPDKEHARNAKARAAQQQKAGNLTKKDQERIDRKADKILDD